MLNPFQKSKLNIRTSTFKPFEKIQEKPDIIKTFTHLYPQATMKRSQRATLANCPIHNEKRPSFAMYDETNTYYCFSCGSHGDSYTLIMEIENVEFKEAIEYAKRHGLYL